MKHLFAASVCLLVLIASGCSMCSPGFLDDYATVGGKWQRSDPTHGRVGSVFSDAGSSIGNGYIVEDGQHYSGEADVYYPDEFNSGDVYSDEYYPEDAEIYYEDSDDGMLFEGSTDEAYPDGHDVIILGDSW